MDGWNILDGFFRFFSANSKKLKILKIDKHNKTTSILRNNNTQQQRKSKIHDYYWQRYPVD